jgi:hypothetical protein
MALKLVLLNPNHNGRKVKDRSVLGKYLLAISSNLEKTNIDPVNELFDLLVFEHTRESVARLSYFSHSGIFKHNFARTAYQWLDLPKTPSFKKVFVADSVNLDFESEFFDETGMSIKEFVLSSFIYVLKLYGLNVKTNDPQEFAIMKGFWSKTTLSSEKEKIIRDFLHQSLNEFIPLYEESVKSSLGGSEYFLTNFMPFVLKPVVDIKDSFSMISDPHCLEEKVNSGPYWILLNRFKRLGKEKTHGRDLSKYYGLIHQEYVSLLLKSVCTKVFRIEERNKIPTCDFVGLIEKENEIYLLFIEAKKIHFSLPLVLQSDKESTLKNVSKIMGKDGFGQVYSTINLFENNELGELKEIAKEKVVKIFPIVVTNTFIVEEPLNRRFYEKNLLNDVKDSFLPAMNLPLSQPMFFSSEEIELVEANKTKLGMPSFLPFLLHRDNQLSKVHLKSQRQFIPGFEIESIGHLVSELRPVWHDLYLLKYSDTKNERIHRIFKKWSEETKKLLFPKKMN